MSSSNTLRPALFALSSLTALLGLVLTFLAGYYFWKELGPLSADAQGYALACLRLKDAEAGLDKFQTEVRNSVDELDKEGLQEIEDEVGLARIFRDIEEMKVLEPWGNGGLLDEYQIYFRDTIQLGELLIDRELGHTSEDPQEALGEMIHQQQAIRDRVHALLRKSKDAMSRSFQDLRAARRHAAWIVSTLIACSSLLALFLLGGGLLSKAGKAQI